MRKNNVWTNLRLAIKFLFFFVCILFFISVYSIDYFCCLQRSSPTRDGPALKVQEDVQLKENLPTGTSTKENSSLPTLALQKRMWDF